MLRGCVTFVAVAAAAAETVCGSGMGVGVVVVFDGFGRGWSALEVSI